MRDSAVELMELAEWSESKESEIQAREQEVQRLSGSRRGSSEDLHKLIWMRLQKR